MSEQRDQLLLSSMVSRLLKLCEAFEAHYYAAAYYPALLRLRALINAMKPGDKPKEARDGVESLLKHYEGYDPRLDTATVGDPAAKWDRARYANRDLSRFRHRIWGYYETIMEKMHNESYFTAEKWVDLHYPGAQKRDE